MGNVLQTIMTLMGFILILIVVTYAVGAVIDSFVEQTTPYTDLQQDWTQETLPRVYQMFNTFYLVIPLLMVFGFVWAVKSIFFRTRYERRYDEDEEY